ncbi:MAG: MMPL family transporter [Planctomycetes bacterium]|nr:MMPL family transporter [Planctomycetota bacterium]
MRPHVVHDKLRHNLLGGGARFVCDRPWVVLLAAGLLAAASVGLTVARLGFDADRNDLISASLDWNKKYIEYRRQFSGYDSIAIVVRVPGGEDGRSKAEDFVRATVAKLEHHESAIRRVWWGYDPRQMSPILLRLDPMDSFKTHLAEMSQAGPMLKARNFGDLLSALPAALQSQSKDTTADQAVEMIAQFGTLLDGITQVLEGADAGSTAAAFDLSGQSDWQFLDSDDHQLLFIEIEGEPSTDSVDQFEPAVRLARASLESTMKQMPGIDAGLTGVPVIEADETNMSMRDSTWCSIISVVGIAVLLIVAFHSFSIPLIMVGALMVGVMWSFGYLTLAIGHLQVLSVVFTVILLGLGIDFGIHIVSHFELIRPNHAEGIAGFRQTMIDTIQTTGPGIITGAITTALAFGTTLLTDFTGMAEMGNIAAVGVMLCMLAMLTVMPALLRLCRPQLRHNPSAEGRLIDMHRQGWIMQLIHRPVITCLVAGAIVALSFVGMARVRYDNNLMNLLPEGLASVRWQQRVLDHSAQSLLYGVSITDSLDVAKRRAEQFRQLPSVASVGGVGLMFPADEDEKVALIEETRKQIAPLLDSPVTPEAIDAGGLAQRLTGLNLVLSIALNRDDVKAEPKVHEALSQLFDKVRRIQEVLADAKFKEHASERMAALHGLFVSLQTKLRWQIDQSLLTRPLRVDDLPALMRREVVSIVKPVRYQLKVYPKANVWDPGAMKPYIEEVRSVDGNFTGSPVQIYESGLLMQWSYQKAGALALIAVLIVAYLDFLRLVDALLCLLPVSVAFVLTFAMMWLFDVTINPANIIVLPLMFGIGVASGVHIMHRYRQNPRRRPAGLSQGTGKGIILTSGTTILAFASMLFAEHRGIRSLGFVLAVGISMTLIVCMTIMPAVLELRNRIHVWRRLRQWRRAQDGQSK